MVNFSFAQVNVSSYTYVDAAGNTFLYSNGTLAYTPVNAGTGAVYTGTTAKTVELNKVDMETLDKLIKTAIETKADHVNTRESGASTIKYKQLQKDVKVHLKSNSGTKNALDQAIAKIMVR